jgi:hypothetical protein
VSYPRHVLLSTNVMLLDSCGVQKLELDCLTHETPSLGRVYLLAGLINKVHSSRLSKILKNKNLTVLFFDVTKMYTSQSPAYL